MNAILYEKYGSLDVLELGEVPKPTLKDNDVPWTIHVRAVTVGVQWAQSGKDNINYGKTLPVETDGRGPIVCRSGTQKGKCRYYCGSK